MTGHTGLKRKMIMGSIAAIMIPFIITGAIIYIQLSGSLMEIAKEKSLHQSNDISNGLDDFFEANLRLITSIAAGPGIIHASKVGDYEIAEHELKAVYESFQWKATTLFLTDQDGIIRFDARFPRQLGFDVSGRDYFIKAKNGVANVSDPVFANKDSDSEIIILICAPIFDDKAFLGICGLIFTAEYIAYRIENLTMSETGYVYLLNKQGLVLMHPEPDLVLKRNLFELPATSVIKTMVKSGQSGVASYIVDGKQKIAGISQVEHTGWTVAYAQTRDEIMAPVNKLLNYVFISGILFLVISIIIVIIVSGRISSPIQKMMEAVSQVTRYSTEVIVQISLDRKIIFANPAFEKITGIKAESIVGTVPGFENTARIPAQTIWQELESGNAWSGQLEIKAENSKNIIILDVMIVPVRNANGRVQAYMVIGRDVTDELMFEKRMNQAQKLESIGTLAGGIAHDFNNILSIIFGYAELSLLGKGVDSHIEKNIRQIVIASERARELVTQILSFSRHGGEVELMPVKLDIIVKEALKLVRASTPSFIIIESDIDSSACVMADPTQIHQMVMNLFTNAVHAIGENPGTVTLELQDFMVDSEFTKTHPGINQGRHILFRITDTGCGMTGETIEHIFDPFFTTKSKKKGTGLGLSVVHGIVKKMKGIVTVYSRVGEGTIFNVVLPAVQSDANGLREISPIIQHGTERIALIDDEINIAAAMQSILINIGYRVTAFTDSVQALAQIQAASGDFDLIMTDYAMPDLTGVDMVKKLRAAGVVVPVILMSGFLGNNIEASAKQAGITQFLFKPANTYQISKSIRKALGD